MPDSPPDDLRATIARVEALCDTLTPITGEYHAVVADQHLPPCIACLILEQLRTALTDDPTACRCVMLTAQTPWVPAEWEQAPDCPQHPLPMESP